jgi:PAS domain S-box-containing protein
MATDNPKKQRIQRIRNVAGRACALMMRPEAISQFGTAVRWTHGPAWFLIVSLVGVVRLYLRPMIRPLVVLCAGFALTSVGVAHQTSRTDPTYLIETWETDDGLPENSATAMVQTPDGYLWFGTLNGLVRFDGVTFTVFDRANTPQLPSASIVNLHCDRSGRLWVSTLSGLAVREGGQWRALRSNDGWPSDHVRTFSERGNGDLLITTFHGQVFEFVGGRLTELPPPPGKSGMGYLGSVDEAGHWWVAQYQFVGLWDGQSWRQTVASTTTNSDRVGCTKARDGGVWLLVEKELRKYRQGVEVLRVRLPELPGAFWSMSEDSLGNVWISTYRQGICRVSADGQMRRWTTTNGLFSSSTRFVFEDREGNLWVGTGEGGLARFKPRRIQSFGVESGLPELVVNSLWPGRDDALWITTQGKGLLRLHDGRVTNVPMAVGVNDAQSVLTDRNGRLWLGTSRGLLVSVKEGFRRIHSEQLGSADIRALFEDSRGRIWIGGLAIASVLDGASLRVFTGADGLPAGGALCFAEDSHGVIWLSTDNGVFRWENDRFVELLDNGQPLRNITCLKVDADGTLWMGSRDKGLLCRRDGRLARIGSLPIRAVHGILEDDAGFFWLASNRGVMRVLAKDLRLAAEGNVPVLDSLELDLSDGLPSVEFPSGVQPNCARDASGRLWFATLKGVAMIDPAVFRLNTSAPPVTVEQVVYHTTASQSARQPAHDSTVQPLNGSTTQNEVEVSHAAPFTEPLRLPAGSRHIEIYYTALSFTAPEDVQFQVKLDGQDANWWDTADRRVAFYDLPPGDYLFHVRAANNDGIWNETGASVAFTVLPFFWETWWFRIVAGLALLASGAAVTWLMARARLRNAAERERAAQAYKRSEGARNNLAAIVETSDDAILSKNLEGVITSWNAGAEKMFGYSAGEIVGQHYSTLAPPVLKGEVRRILERVNRGESVDHLETVRVSKEGMRIDVSLTISPIKNERGMIIGSSSIARDITARKKAESEGLQQRTELAHLSRVTMLGELSGSLAHELNQPLTAILSNAQAAQRFLAYDDVDLNEVRDILGDIVKQDKRAGEVIHRLRLLLKKSTVEHRLLDLNDVVSEVLKLVSNDLLNQRVIGQMELAPELPAIVGDRVQLQQVVLNLVMNGCDAIATGPSSDRKLIIRTELDNGDGICVSVADQGVGLSPDNLEKVFEPFFSTKPHGMGLGLSVCRTIIAAHGGKLWAANNAERGVTFYFTIPAPVELQR